MTATTLAKRPSLWHHVNFRRLWVGDAVSQVGTAVSMLALPLTAIVVLKATPFEVGLLTACESLAFLVVGLPAGAWVDRMRHKRVLTVNDVLRAVAFGSVPLAAALDVLTIGQMYGVALVTGVCRVFFDVTWQSYLPEIVEPADLVPGNAKLTATESVAQVAGPPLGGALIQALTAPYAVLVDALSFLWSASWVAAIEDDRPRPERKPGRSLGKEIGEGLRFVLHNRLLRAIAATTGSSNFFSSMAEAVFLVLLARDLHVSAGVIGLLTSVAAVGGLLASVVAAPIAARIGQGPAIWLAILVSAPASLVVPFAQNNWMLLLVALSQLLHWGGAVVYNINQVSFRQGLCPRPLLGRMNATMRFLVWGTMPLGALVGGILGSMIGVRETLFVAAVGGCFTFLPVFLSPLRTMRELPTGAATETPGAPVPAETSPGPLPAP